MTTTGYSGQQVNIKRNDGMLINITGADVPELKQNIEDFIEHVAPLLDELGNATNAAALVGNQLGARPVQESGSPAQSVSAPPAQAAPTGEIRVEQGKWGDSYEIGRPDAPLTPYGPAVLKRAKSKAGNVYAQWIDPRAKTIPSVYASGVRQDPSPMWEAQFAARGI